MLRNVDDWDGEHFAFRLDGVPQDAAKTVVSAHDGPAGPSVTIPDADFLFHADFKRAGSDLILTGDHKTTIVRDYFATDERATLFAGNGMSLSPDVVEALAGPMAPGQYAQADGAQQGAQAVGRVAKVEGSVTVVRNGVAITVNVGDAILKGDVLQTGNGQLGVTFNDGSTFNLTENARLVVNEFIYDPKGNANSQILNLVQGSLTFISGEVAHSGDMKIGTPVATMGIRGTVGGVNDASTDQVSFFIVQSDRGAVLTDSNGTVIAQVVQNGPLVVLRPAGPLQVVAEEVQKTPEQVAAELAALQHIVSVQAVGQQIIQQFFQNQDPNNPQSQGSDHTQIQIDIPKSGIFGENSNNGGSNGGTGDNTATVTITTNNDPNNTPNTSGEPQIITVEIPDNLPPVNFGPLNATINEDNTLTFTGVNAVSVFDNDTNTLTVTLSATNGTLSLGGIAGLVFTNGDGQDDVTMTFTGLQAAINAALNGSTFTPTQDYNGPASIVITTSDGNQTRSATIDITIDPVNDAPVIATPATNPSTDEDTAVQISGISVGDVDSAALTVTLTAGSTLTLAQTDNLTFTEGDGTDDSTMTFSGAAAAINAALDGLTFAPTPDATSGHIDVTVSDGSANVTETVTVDVAPVNDAPVITPGGDVSGGVVKNRILSVSGELDATDADSGAVLAWTLQGGAPGEVASDNIGNVDYTFAIDQLHIVRNSNNDFFTDNFDNNDPPPSGDVFPNGSAGSYATSGVFTETGGRAVMDGTQAGPTQSALFTSIPFLGHFATLLTDASNAPGDLNSGLKIDDDFTVEGRFDLTSPDEPGEGYGIRLTDRGGPDAQAGDDVMELRVVRNANGDLQVSFRERDFVAGEVNNIDSILLDPTGADQIVLRLGHQVANPGVVTASFDLLNSGTVIDTVTFSNTGQIFGTETPGNIADDELWTRAQFFAFSPGEVVGSSLVGNYGTLSINQDGEWAYQLNNDLQQVQALAVGQQVTDTFTAVVADETGATDTQDITVTVTGINDAVYVEDQFNSQAYSLDTGSVNWAGNWVENENDDFAPSPTTGEIRVANDPSITIGDYRLLLSDDDSESGADDTIQRTVDLSAAVAATLSFDYRRDIPNGSSDDIFPVLISLDGTNFDQIGQIGATGNGSFVDSNYQHFSFDISGYISANTTIRFAVGDDVDDGDVVYVDNVKISYVPEVTLTVVTPDGYDMHFLYGDIANSEINLGTAAATQFDAENAGSGHTFRVTGTGFTYDVNGDLTGGTVNSINIRSTETSATLVTMTGFAINAVALASAVDAFANNGNPVPLSTIFNGHSYSATGGDGNDVIPSFIRADSFDGGDGLNSVDYVHYGQGITVNLADPSQNTGNAAGDSYTNINTIIGTNYNDTLIGDGNINALEGGAGGDSLTGGGGPLDYASYIHAPSAVTANLADPNQNTGHAAGDSYSGINGLLGSNFSDTLVGDGNDNFLRGRGGGDALDGAGGSDTADYLRRGAVTADLTAPGNNTGDAAGDTYTSIENLRGSNFADTLRGDGGNNVITGMGGNDTMTGEAGADTFVFHPGDGNDHVTDFSLDDFLQFDQSVFVDAQAVIDASGSGGPGVTTIAAGADTITLDSIDHSVFQTIDHGHIIVV